MDENWQTENISQISIEFRKYEAGFLQRSRRKFHFEKVHTDVVSYHRRDVSRQCRHHDIGRSIADLTCSRYSTVILEIQCQGSSSFGPFQGLRVWGQIRVTLLRRWSVFIRRLVEVDRTSILSRSSSSSPPFNENVIRFELLKATSSSEILSLSTTSSMKGRTDLTSSCSTFVARIR